MVKDFLKLVQTQNRVSPLYLETKTEKNFCYSLPGKKVGISYGNLRISRITKFKNSSFSSAQNFFKLDQTRYWVSHEYLESKT